MRSTGCTASTCWDEECDVVAGGGGAARLMAAVEAAAGGASVLLVEKQPGVGAGAIAMLIGSISAAGTALQRAAGRQYLSTTRSTAVSQVSGRTARGLTGSQLHQRVGEW